jgi:hypothetical protein
MSTILHDSKDDDNATEEAGGWLVRSIDLMTKIFQREALFASASYLDIR